MANNAAKMELFVMSVAQDTKFLTGFALQTPAIIITVIFAKAMAFVLTVILISIDLLLLSIDILMIIIWYQGNLH